MGGLRAPTKDFVQLIAQAKKTINLISIYFIMLRVNYGMGIAIEIRQKVVLSINGNSVPCG